MEIREDNSHMTCSWGNSV